MSKLCLVAAKVTVRSARVEVLVVAVSWHHVERLLKTTIAMAGRGN